jgi:hypothetical protein
MLGSVKTAVEQMRHFTVSEAFAELLDLEQKAPRILQIQPWHVPGVLQVPEYAAATLAALSGKKPDDPDVQERVKLRMVRADAFRRRLESASPPVFGVVLDRQALTLPDKNVVRAQLTHLRQVLIAHPSLQVAVTSLREAGYVETRTCEVFERQDSSTATFFESPDSADEITTDPAVGRKYRDQATSLLAAYRVDEKALAQFED